MNRITAHTSYPHLLTTRKLSKVERDELIAWCLGTDGECAVEFDSFFHRRTNKWGGRPNRDVDIHWVKLTQYWLNRLDLKTSDQYLVRFKDPEDAALAILSWS